MNRKYLFEIEIYCKIINVFKVSFDHFNAFSLNEMNNSYYKFFKKSYWPQAF